MTGQRMTHEISRSHWPLLGTVLDVRVEATDRAAATSAEQIVVAEIERLEQTFSVFDGTSMLRRWSDDPATTTSDEFDELLSIALGWQRRSRGAFNVRTRRLWDLWAKAADDQTRPNPDELLSLANEIADAPYRVEECRIQQIDDCHGIDLNAIAKGFIVDRAVDAAWRACELVNLTISAGGDIAHRGTSPIEIGIEDPTSTLDNAPPLRTLQIQNAAVATSGSTRRGISVNGDWVSHVIDPRTGQPAEASLSVTIVAPDATTTDAVATIVNVLDPADGLRFVDSLNSPGNTTTADPIECWIVDRDATLHHAGS